MEVSVQQFKNYLETFHSQLEQVAGKYLPEPAKSQLLHLAPLPATIQGYVSTSHGVGWEYRNADKTRVNVVTGNSRIENVTIAAPERYELSNQTASVGFSITASNFTMAGSGIQWDEGKFPLRLDSPEASCRLIGVSFHAGAWRRQIPHAEMYANKSASEWSGEKAVARADDEVLAALLELKLAHARDVSLGDYIKQYKDKKVLVLGAYSDEAMRKLKSICEALRKLGYDAMLAEDIPDHPHQSLLQKVTVIGGLCRFIVIEDSFPSGHLLELGRCIANQWVTVILREEGRGSSRMTAGASVFSKVTLEREYRVDNLGHVIREATQWAEERLGELEKDLTNIYPWRPAH